MGKGQWNMGFRRQDWEGDFITVYLLFYCIKKNLELHKLFTNVFNAYFLEKYNNNTAEFRNSKLYVRCQCEMSVA